MKLFEKLGLKDQTQLDAVKAALAEGADDATIDTAASTLIDSVAPLVTGNGKFMEAHTSGAFNRGRTDAFDKIKLTIGSVLGVDVKAAKDATELVGIIAKSGSKEDPTALKNAIKQEFELETNAKIQKLKESHAEQLRNIKGETNLDRSLMGVVGGKKTKLGIDEVAILAKTKLNTLYTVQYDADGNLAKILNKDGTEPVNASQTAKLSTVEILSSIVDPYIEKEVKPTEQERKGVILGGNAPESTYGKFK